MHDGSLKKKLMYWNS